MCELIIFGGTTEARALVAKTEELGLSVLLCLATDYDPVDWRHSSLTQIMHERLDAAEMSSLIREKKPSLVIDATHPYAQIVGENIRQACAETGVELLRILRPTVIEEGVMEFDEMEELIDFLNREDNLSKTVFSTLGAKELAQLTAVENYRERLWVRVLPYLPSLQACLDHAYLAKQTVCIQGPFSRELNKALFAFSGAEILLTKDSGAAGGVQSKIEAAMELGMEILVLKRPLEESGLSLEACLAYLEETFVDEDESEQGLRKGKENAGSKRSTQRG